MEKLIYPNLPCSSIAANISFESHSSIRVKRYPSWLTSLFSQRSATAVTKFRGRQEIFLFTWTSEPAVGSTCLVLFLGIKQPMCQSNHSHRPTAQIKNWWSYTSTPHILEWRAQGQLYLLLVLQGPEEVVTYFLTHFIIHHPLTTHNNSQTSYKDLKLPPLESRGSYTKTTAQRKLRLSEPWSESSLTAKIQNFCQKTWNMQTVREPQMERRI
jgi:hypothetical protein